MSAISALACTNSSALLEIVQTGHDNVDMLSSYHAQQYYKNSPGVFRSEVSWNSELVGIL